MEIQTSAGPAVLWLRARQLCYLGGHAPESGEMIGRQTLMDDMAADLADSLKAGEEDRKTDHAPLVQVKENEVDMLTATIETDLRQGDLETGVDGMKGDLTETETKGNEALSEWEGERQKSRADELRSTSLLKSSSPQSMRSFLWPSDSTDGCAQRKCCGSLVKAQSSTWAHSSPRLKNGRTKESTTRVQVLFTIMLGSVLDGQPTESQRHEKVNAWLCARRTTHHDLISVVPDEKRRKRQKKLSCKTVTYRNCFRISQHL